MAIAYQPGDEITLEVEVSSLVFKTKAMSWSEQKQFKKSVESIKSNENEAEQIDLAIESVVTRGLTVNGEPATAELLSSKIDKRALFFLLVAMENNLTHEEKKSSE